jgi:hypothetical protein
MSYTASADQYGIPHLVSHAIARYCPVIGPLGGATSGAWLVANLAIYVPLVIRQMHVARRLWWVNGATVSATYNVDVGLYLDAGQKPGAKIVSAGSTAQGTASEIQFVDITDTSVPVGIVWIAMSCSSTSATFHRQSVTGGATDAAIGFQEAGAVPLPATATPVEFDQTVRAEFICGFATTASP